MKLKKAFLFFSLMFVIPVYFFGIRVAEDELRNRIPKNIRFVNYSGERQHQDPVDEIIDIGKQLSDTIQKGHSKAGYGILKYTLWHLVDPNETGKLDADILQIDPLSRVDHIFGIRMILAGYLSRQYAYSFSQAKALAVFITYYNAFYRKNIKYFQSRFKKKVNQVLDAEKAGLSLSYEDWPGNSQIVIPLTSGGASGSELARDSVIEKMRESEDKNIESRQEMNRLRKEDLKKKKQDLDRSEKDLQKKQEKLKEREKRIQEEKKKLSEEKRKTENLAEGPEKQKKQAELKRKEEKLFNEEEDLKKQEKSVLKEKKGLEEEKKKLREEETKIQKEDENIRNDQADLKIQKDQKAFQQELKEKDKRLAEKEKELAQVEQQLKEGKTDKRIAAGRLYYLKTKEYMSGGHYNNEMYLINVLTHQVEKKSDFTNICGKDYHVFKDGVVVIGHGGGKNHSSGHFLVLLDGKTLELRAKGNADVFWRSFVEIRNDAFYVVILKDRKFYLAKFNADLQLEAVSPEPVFKDTFISFFGDVLYVSSQNKGILVLKQSDLSLVDSIEAK